MFLEKFATQVDSEDQTLNLLRSRGLDQFTREVVQEVDALLNSRRPLFEDLPYSDLGSLTFGIPDFLHLSMTNPDDIRTIEMEVRESIRQYEPRLDNIKVEIGREDKVTTSLGVKVEAELRVGKDLQLISFHIFVPSTDPRQRRHRVTL